MNRISPLLFSGAFTAWAREAWPDKPDFVAIDGKTSRRSHNRSAGTAALHLVPAYATTTGLVLGQQAVADKNGETTAIPVILKRLDRNGGLQGSLVSIDAVATNAVIAKAITAQGADYLLAVKSNQPTLWQEIELYFQDAPVSSQDETTDLDKGHGWIEGHGAKNMAVVRYFAIDPVRTISDNRSTKLRRKRSGWNTEYRASILDGLAR